MAKCQNARFHIAKCQNASFQEAQCQFVNFEKSECQGADFRSAQCQGALLIKTYLQGAYFKDTKFQGAYTPKEEYIIFQQVDPTERIGKNTDIFSVYFAGELNDTAIASINTAIASIKESIELLLDSSKMKKIIEDNKGKPLSEEIPDGIITGILEDSEKIRQIIKKLKEIHSQYR